MTAVEQTTDVDLLSLLIGDERPGDRETITILFPCGKEFTIDAAWPPFTTCDAGPVDERGFSTGPMNFDITWSDMRAVRTRVIWHRRILWWLKAPWRFARRVFRGRA